VYNDNYENWRLHSILIVNCSLLYFVSGFRYGVRSSLFRYVTQRLLVASYRRFGTASRSHLHVSTAGLVKMGPTGCPETSLTRNQRCLTPQNCE